MSDLRQLLLDTAALYADLADALHGTRTGNPTERTTGGSTEKPLPLDADVADHRHQLVQGLRYWVHRTNTPGTPARHMQRVPAMVAILVSRVGRLTPDDRDELAGNLTDWQRRAHTRTDLPRLRSTIPLPDGTCPDRTELDGETLYACPGALRVLIPADTHHAPWLQCRECRTRYDVTELPQAANVELPLAQAAEVTGIPLSTIKTWAQVGKLPTRGHPAAARLGDVLAAQSVRTAHTT